MGKMSFITNAASSVMKTKAGGWMMSKVAGTSFGSRMLQMGLFDVGTDIAGAGLKAGAGAVTTTAKAGAFALLIRQLLEMFKEHNPEYFNKAVAALKERDDLVGGAVSVATFGMSEATEDEIAAAKKKTGTSQGATIASASTINETLSADSPTTGFFAATSAGADPASADLAVNSTAVEELSKNIEALNVVEALGASSTDAQLMAAGRTREQVSASSPKPSTLQA